MLNCFSPQKSSKKEASSSKPPQKRKSKGRDEEGSDKKKTRKKKDPNAPKRAMTPFMYFSMAERAVSSFDSQSSPLHKQVLAAIIILDKTKTL
jgi:hypothetical protein